MPQLLRGIWVHIYPGSPSPRFSVYRDRQPHIPDQYRCVVTLSSGGSDANNVAYTFESAVCTHANQAVQEASWKAITGIRHRDPEMAIFRRYAFYPRFDSPDGEVIFPVCPQEEDPAIVHLSRYTAALHQQYMSVIRILADTRHALATLMLTQATEVNDPALAAPPPPPDNVQTIDEDDSPPRYLSVNPPRTMQTPRRTSTEFGTHPDLEPPSQLRRMWNGPSPESAFSRYTAAMRAHVEAASSQASPPEPTLPED